MDEHSIGIEEGGFFMTEVKKYSRPGRVWNRMPLP